MTLSPYLGQQTLFRHCDMLCRAMYGILQYFSTEWSGKVSWYHFSSTIKKKVENAFSKLLQSWCNKTLMFLCLWIKTMMPGKISSLFPFLSPNPCSANKNLQKSPEVLIMGIFLNVFHQFSMRFFFFFFEAASSFKKKKNATFWSPIYTTHSGSAYLLTLQPHNPAGFNTSIRNC